MRKLLQTMTIGLALLLMTPVATLSAEEGYKFVELKQTQDFAALGAQSRQEGRAILLMFSGEHCRFCVTAEEYFLKPMLRSGDYDGMITMHKLDLTRDNELTNFDGSPISTRELADRYGVYVMPTVVFIDDRGDEVGKQRVGLMTEAFYGEYLDLSIRAAAAAMQGGAQSAIQ